MNKAYLKIVTLTILVVSISYYLSNNTLSSEDKKIDVVKLKLFSLKSATPWLIKVPDIEAYAALSELTEGASCRYANGRYSADFERGTVSLEYTSIATLNSNTRKMRFVAPFYVSNQGSGVFAYLGLFELDHEQSEIQHIDSVFLGDRIDMKSVQVGEPTDQYEVINIEFLQHSDQQSMVEQSLQLVQKQFSVTANRFIFLN